MVAQERSRSVTPYAYNDFSSNKHMITGQYLVCCPKLDEREYVMGMDNAADVLYSMHCESDSYAWCEDWLGHTVMEYGDPVDGIAEMVFG